MNSVMFDYALEIISKAVSNPIDGLESWTDGNTLTVMYDDPTDGRRQYAKLRLVRISDIPSRADLRGESEWPNRLS